MTEVTSSAVTGLGTTNLETTQPMPSVALQAQAVAPVNDLLRYLDNHWTLIDTLSWTNAAQPGTILFSRPITPRESFPVLEHYAKLYNTWSGSINYRVQVVGTAFLGGKIACALLPPNFNPRVNTYTAQQLSVFPYELEDVKNINTMDFGTGDMNAQKFHYFPTSQDNPYDPKFIGGWFVVYVVNQLVTSGGTLGSVTLQLSCNARGMFFSGIIPPVSETPGSDLEPFSLKPGDSLPFGDTYQGIALFSPADMPTASVYLDGVRKGDSSFYTTRQLSMLGTNTCRFNYTGTSPVDLNTEGMVLPRQKLNLSTWVGVYDGSLPPGVLDASSEIKTSTNTVIINASHVTAGNYTNIPCPTPLHVNAIECTSDAFDPSLHFTPLGTAPESFMMIRGAWKLNNLSVLPFTSYLYWQPHVMEMTSTQCVFGQVTDDLTGTRLCFFKAYYQGFITTSAVATTTIVDHPVTFTPISIVDPHYPIPGATADMMLAQMAMNPREELKREKKHFKKLLNRKNEHPPVCSLGWNGNSGELDLLGSSTGTCGGNIPTTSLAGFTIPYE